MKRALIITLVALAILGAAWWMLARYPVRQAHENGEVAAKTADGYVVITSVDVVYKKPIFARFHSKKSNPLSEETARAAGDAAARFRLEELFASDRQAIRSISESVSDFLKKKGCAITKAPVVGIRIESGQFGLYVSAHTRKTGAKFIVLGMDGMDWKVIESLIAQGRMPNIEKMIREGASGNLRSIEPILSPLIWTTMATGKLPEKHGIADFIALSDKGATIPINSTYRKVPALWQMFGWGGVKAGFAGWLASWPAEKVDGYIVTDRAFLQSARRMDKNSDFRSGQTWPPALMDEIRPLIKDASVKADAVAQGFLNSDFPNSAAYFSQFNKRTNRISVLKDAVGDFLSMRAVGLKLLKDKKPEMLGIYFEGPDTTSHEFMEFAAPKRDWISETDYKAFKDVVARMYELADRTVGMYLAAAGGEYNIIIVSDHGFKSGALRPKDSGAIEGKAAAMWHRIMGTLVASGPDIAKGKKITQASVTDIAPTLLYGFGLPSGADMDGMVISGLFTDSFKKENGAPRKIASYDWGWQPRNKSAASGGAAADKEVMDRLKQLGYINADGTKRTAPAGKAAAGINPAKASKAGRDPEARKFANLGTRDMQEKRYQDAIADFKKALGIDTASPLLMLSLADAYLKSGDAASADKTMQSAAALGENMPAFHSNYGALLLGMGRLPEAEKEFRIAIKLDPGLTEAYNNLGLIAYKSHRYKEAIGSYLTALKLEPDSALSRLNLGITYWELKDFKNTADQLELAFALNRNYEKYPKLLAAAGISLFEVGETGAAARRLQQTLVLQPNMPEAHYYLGLIAEKKGDKTAARAHYQSELRVSPNDNRTRLRLNSLH